MSETRPWLRLLQFPLAFYRALAVGATVLLYGWLFFKVWIGVPWPVFVLSAIITLALIALSETVLRLRRRLLKQAITQAATNLTVWEFVMEDPVKS